MKQVTFLFLCFILATAPLSHASAQKQFYTQLHGKVTDESGKPLSSVAVTDGQHVVYTNAKGAYQLLSPKTSAFVYISIPSGFEIPHDNYLPAFYQKIDHSKNSFRAVFRLNKMKKSDMNHRVMVIADPQIHSQEQARELKEAVDKYISPKAAQLVAEAPAHGLVLGDLTWDNQEIVESYKSILEAIPIPMFQVVGNHDLNYNVRSHEKSTASFEEAYGPSWYSFNRGKVHYVVLNNVFYYSDRYFYIGYVDERQLNWLEQDLKQVPKGNTVVISVHIPFYNNEKKLNNRKEDNIGNITLNREHVFELLKDYNAYIFSGHMHYQDHYRHGQVREHLHASPGGAWWSTATSIDGTPAGYTVYEVEGNDFRWYYQALGRTKDEQMTVHTDSLSAYQKVLVNVWNWDEDWKVELWEDGTYSGQLAQQPGIDPGANSEIRKPDFKGASWISPTVTQHLFVAKVREKTKKIEIKATDPFGNVYSQTITNQ